MAIVSPRKPDRRTEADDLRMELVAFHAERHQLGLELRHLGRLVYRAVLHERDDLAIEASGRLDHLSGRLIRQGDPS
jgi:hypothetical protein